MFEGRRSSNRTIVVLVEPMSLMRAPRSPVPCLNTEAIPAAEAAGENCGCSPVDPNRWEITEWLPHVYQRWGQIVATCCYFLTSLSFQLEKCCPICTAVLKESLTWSAMTAAPKPVCLSKNQWSALDKWCARPLVQWWMWWSILVLTSQSFQTPTCTAVRRKNWMRRPCAMALRERFGQIGLVRSHCPSFTFDPVPGSQSGFCSSGSLPEGTLPPAKSWAPNPLTSPSRRGDLCTSSDHLIHNRWLLLFRGHQWAASFHKRTPTPSTKSAE